MLGDSLGAAQLTAPQEGLSSVSKVGVESQLGPLDTSPISGLLYLPRVIVRRENLVD
jgi:hypothetical protein